MQQLSKYGLICFCTEMNLLARNNCNANFKQTVSSIFLKLTWKQNSLPKIKYRTSSWKTSWRREPCRKTAHNKTWKWKSGIVSLSSYGFFFSQNNKWRMICTGYNNFPTNFNIFLHHCHTMLSSYCTNSLLITFFLAFHHTLSHFYNADNCLFTPYPFISVFIFYILLVIHLLTKRTCLTIMSILSLQSFSLLSRP